MIKLGVLVSGSGTNLQAILGAIAAETLDAEVALVVSNKPNVKALERAAAVKVPTVVLDHRAQPSREAFDEAMVAALRAHGAEWVVLAGFMRLVTPVLLDAYPMRVINIHPALSPAFPGVDAQAQALAYGVKVTGCTVHFVDKGTDTGPIIAQAAIDVLDSDDVESLKARLLITEHELLTRTLQSIALGRVRVTEGGKGERPRVVVAKTPAT
jgi:phosphoribosylglycinamide formyltransferase 1